MGDEKVEVINIKNVLEIIYKNILVRNLLLEFFLHRSFYLEFI